MRFEIVVAPEPDLLHRSEARDPEPPPLGADDGGDAPRPRASATARRRPPAREVLDVFLDGANVTARVAERHAACVLRDLAAALAGLAARPRGKAIVRFYDDAWELCVERFGDQATLSVYRTGADPDVAVLDRAVPFREVVESARGAIASVLGRPSTTGPVAAEMRGLEAALAGVNVSTPRASTPAIPALAAVTLEIDRDAPISFGAEFALRPGEDESHFAGDDDEAADASVERADLHALLFRGRVRAEIRGRAVDLGEGHPFLVAERLLDVARQSLETWERGQALHLRGLASGMLLGVRLTSDGQLALSLRGARPEGGALASARSMHTFPALRVVDFVEGSLAFGRALVRAVLRRDRAQGTNLRLSAFRRALRETGDVLREACQKDAKINPTPEPYRDFAIARAGSRPAEGAPMPAGTKLRYSPRWRALVPGIDLRSTFLCGDRLVVGAAAETFCLDRSTGEVLWRTETERATSVVTPGGLARIHPDGLLAVHDFGTGEVSLRTWLAPRLGGPSSGAVVHVQGLPRLLIVTEGERHLVAVDLTSGEPRWRHAWGSGTTRKSSGSTRGVPRLRRAGKLLYFTSGDSALTALDVLTGATVWRVRDRLRFRLTPTLDHDALFAVAGGAGSAAQLHGIDAFSGKVRWSSVVRASALGGGVACTIEGGALAARGTVALPVRDREGLSLVAHDRETGAPLWDSGPRVAPSGTAWLAVDDLFIGNTPTGEIVALDAATGELRYRHLLGRALEHDVPRRLEPVLRSGALFVPHVDVHILRPSDGAPIGTIAPCDAIPDLLRVDERCDVYLAEESGHLVSFGAGPRLSLVK
ncbi:MAG TPA: PQQ-binding-like beta-propeller repeat protein [Polyangiaceae bacterium]